jgi:nucleotide-binding universal stress UspA family protein
MIEASTRFGFKRLLLGTDFSPRADVALQRAVQIASEHGAALTLFHACDVGARDDAQGRKLIVGAEETARQKIRSLSLPDKIAAAVRVAAGKPFVELIRAAREEESDLVVVGAHGKHFLKSLLLGTTAEKVVRKGERPVLVVKRATRSPYRQVLVPVDFSEDSRQALALRLAPRGRFYVLHAMRGRRDSSGERISQDPRSCSIAANWRKRDERRWWNSCAAPIASVSRSAITAVRTRTPCHRWRCPPAAHRSRLCRYRRSHRTAAHFARQCSPTRPARGSM